MVTKEHPSNEEEEEMLIDENKYTPPARPSLGLEICRQSTGQSQPKFIESKVGDTLDDMDDSVLSPTPRTADLFMKMDAEGTFSSLIPQ